MNADVIGIWKEHQTDSGSSYLRDNAFQNDWSLWADHSLIPPKTRKRIILLGESVARGYFFDPYYNPAMVLQTLLDTNCDEEFEITDLAKTDLRLVELRDLFRESLKLDPDAIILFAGNNWITDLYMSIDEKDAENIIISLNGKSINGIRNFLEDRIKNLIHEALAEFDYLSKENKVKLFFIIPEYNLADWLEYEDHFSSFHLTEDKISDWKKVIGQVERQKESKNVLKVLDLAEKLIAIDPGNSYGYYLAGKCYRKLGKTEDALFFFRQARDWTIILKSIGKPKILSVIHDAIISAAQQTDISIINLSQIFKANTEDYIPDKNIFLDYCHLNARGIQIAMSYTAQKIISILKEKIIPLQNLINLSKETGPDKKVEAKAHAFAAIHNAHYGQKYDIVLYHCQQAILADCQITAFLKEYAELATLKAPNLICKQYENIIKNWGERQYGGLNHQKNKKLMDIILVKAIIKSIKHEYPNFEQYIKMLRSDQHAVNNFGKINLLESPYALPHYKFFLGKRVQFFEELASTSSFFLVVSKIIPVKLTIIYRIPDAISNYENVRLRVNNREISTFSAVSTWKKTELVISTEYLLAGVNILTIQWPVHLRHSVLNINSTIDDIADFINPCFGQIHEFYASC
ncbi:tetratricopeptide repeat protein [Mucilaginibacter sp. RCC_168]|uniref:tetratricopeptide repeat protein n=1 Tax=Mucilaginibacter sp. RCC_168 TaxID=3239221 RepID=UPI00352461A6